MSFALGLAQGLGQTLQDRLNEKRQREQAEWQMQHDMKRQQLLFEQQQAQAPQIMQQKFDLEKQFRPQAEEAAKWKEELESRFKKDREKLPVVEDEEYLAAMENNDLTTMMRIANQKPELMQHLDKWWQMVGKHSQMMEEYKKKQGILTEEVGKRAELRGTGKSGGRGGSSSAEDRRRVQSLNTLIKSYDSEIKDIRAEMGDLDEDDPRYIELQKEVGRLSQLKNNARSKARSLSGAEEGSTESAADILKEMQGLDSGLNALLGNLKDRDIAQEAARLKEAKKKRKKESEQIKYNKEAKRKLGLVREFQERVSGSEHLMQ